MKISVLVFTGILGTVQLLSAATGFGQGNAETKIHLNYADESLPVIFRGIESQANVIIFYEATQITSDIKSTIKEKSITVGNALNILLKDKNFKWEIRENIISIKKLPSFDLSQPSPVLSQIIAPLAIVQGRVTDSSGNGLAGTTVILKNTKKITQTNQDGYYEIDIPANAVLIFSHIGYETQELKVGSNTVLNVIMTPATSDLDNVIITSLGISRQSKSLVYSKQVIKSESLTGVRDANNVINSLQGKVANAVISQGSGGVGSGARIVLRGNRSIQGSSNALIVVDGVPILNSAASAAASDFSSLQGSDGASNINPDDIESVTVLPGATAAALYGSEAGNGVIVITTKKGTKGKVNVSVNSGAVMESPFSLPKVQNTYGQGFDGNISATGSSWGAKMTGQSYTNYLGEERKYSPEPDNIRDFFRNGLSLNNSIGISGGTDKVQTYLSYTNNSVKGIIPRNNLERHTVNLRTSYQLSKRFSADAKITYMIQNIDHKPRTGETNSPIMDIYQIPRNVSIDDAKNYQYINNIGIPAPTDWPVTPKNFYQNPYWIVNNTSINEERNRIWGFLSAKFSITDWLNITGRANLDKTMDSREDSYSIGTVEFATKPGGYFGILNRTAQQKWFDLILSGNNTITKDIRVDYNIGAIYKRLDNKALDARADGLNMPNRFNLNFATTPFYDEGRYQIETHSVFGQVNFAIKDAIFIDATLRNDWASTLPAPHSFRYYSLGGAVILSDLLTLPSAISFFKANLSYAQVGNGGQFGLLNPTYLFSQGGPNGYLNRDPVFPIPDLKPELITNQEGGIEMMFLNNRLGFTATYYKTISTNQLLLVDLPPATGYSRKYINAGNIQNQGLEFTLKATPVSHRNFSYDVAFNFSINKNKVKELAEGVTEFSLATDMNSGQGRAATPKIKVGGSYGDLYAYKWATDVKNQRLVNASGVPVLTDKQEYIGNFNPKGNLGLSNSFRYKRIFANLLIDGRIGGMMVSGTEMNLAFSGIPGITDQHRDGGWQLGGMDGDGNPVSQSIKAQDFWRTASSQRLGAGEFFAYNATNFRIREMSIGYQFPVGANSVIKSAEISAVARNLAWLYRGKSILDIPGLGKRTMWFDPDMSIGNSNFQGIDYGTLPSTRSIGLNLKLNF